MSAWLLSGSLNATMCGIIAGGYHAPSKSSGATQQIECPPGTYSRGRALECTSCPLGWSQPDYQSMTCLKCSQGKSTLGNGSRICIGKDCTAVEYLDNAATDFSNWKCKACPKGAVCDAIPDATWSAVIARAGYYRMPGPAPQNFSDCLNEDACLGVSASSTLHMAMSAKVASLQKATTAHCAIRACRDLYAVGSMTACLAMQAA